MTRHRERRVPLELDANWVPVGLVTAQALAGAQRKFGGCLDYGGSHGWRLRLRVRKSEILNHPWPEA